MAKVLLLGATGGIGSQALLQLLDPWLACQMYANPKLQALLEDTPLRVCAPVCSLKVMVVTFVLCHLVPFLCTCVLACHTLGLVGRCMLMV